MLRKLESLTTEGLSHRSLETACGTRDPSKEAAPYIFNFDNCILVDNSLF